MLQAKNPILKTALCIGIVFSLVVSTFAVKNIEKKENNFVMPDTAKVEIASNRHTQPEKGGTAGNPLGDLSGYEKKLENSSLEVWFRESIAAIRVVDKRSGYVWGSLKEDFDEELNEKWCEMANSICTIEYYDSEGSQKRESLYSSKSSTSYTWGENSLECETSISDGELSLAFVMTLTDTGLEFEVKNGSVKESDDFLIKSVYFVPFLGCVNQDAIDGYMFVPDGCGALIRFSESADYMSPFEKKVYGFDYGIDATGENEDIMAERPNDFAVEAPHISYPVYGIVHGAEQNAVFSEILSGEEYAVVTAYPSGFTTDFNWVGARFDYRQKYVQPTGQEGQGIETPQANANNMCPKLSVTFLTGDNADYAGMAQIYRNRLIKRGILGEERKDTELPMQVTFIGSEVKKGFLAMSHTELTTVSQAEKILSSIKNMGINNLTVVYSGWLKGGLSGSDFGTVKTENKIGSLKDFKALNSSVSKSGGRFYLNVNPVTVNESQTNPADNSATTIGKEFEKIIRDNPEALFNEKFILQPREVADYAKKLTQKYDFNLCFEELGSKLYSDYSRNKNLSRSQTRQIFEKLSSMADSPTAYFGPNKYMWKNTSEYFGISMVNSQYIYETDTVPFLQMVLKGSIDYYAPYANQGFYTQSSILKMIEYGAYPSVLLMAEDNYSLHNTPLEDYFSLQYDSWRNNISDIYEKISGALEAVEGESMTDHKVLSKGIIVTEYSNGTKIVVNYTSKAVDTDYGTVEANSYLVKEG